MQPAWHPVFLTTEVSPGVWEMQHQTSYGPFGRIEIRRVRDQVRYKVTLGRDVIGWATSLQVACEKLYRAWIDEREKGRRGPPNGIG